MPQAPFDADVVRRALRPLVPDAPLVLTAEEDAYLRHYDIHFAEEFPDLGHTFGRISTPSHELSAHLWRPRDAAGTAVVLHGYFDHVGLYGHLIRFLLERNFAVLAFDLPGHGLSSGAQATIETFDHYVAAFDACLDALGGHLPKPWHLFGQSTGGAIAMEWVLANRLDRQSSPFEHIVLLAPLVRPYQWPVNRVLYEIARRFVKERERTFTTNAENPEFLRFLRESDPLQARVLPVQWVTAMKAWKERFERYGASDLAPLVIQGHADKTVDWRYNMAVIERLFEPEIYFIPEARHQLVNESEAIRRQMFAKIDEKLGVSANS